MKSTRFLRQPRLRDHQRRVARQDARQHSRGARGAAFAALPLAERAERCAGGAREFLLRQAGFEPRRRHKPFAGRSRPDVDDRDKPGHDGWGRSVPGMGRV